jgi:hypothetical protein
VSAGVTRSLRRCHEEAVEIYVRLADPRPDAFLLDLAMSLNNQSNRLSELGRREPVLAAIEEAIELVLFPCRIRSARSSRTPAPPARRTRPARWPRRPRGSLSAGAPGIAQPHSRRAAASCRARR